MPKMILTSVVELKHDVVYGDRLDLDEAIAVAEKAAE
jgi:hypothetical protein